MLKPINLESEGTARLVERWIIDPETGYMVQRFAVRRDMSLLVGAEGYPPRDNHNCAKGHSAKSVRGNAQSGRHPTFRASRVR